MARASKRQRNGQLCGIEANRIRTTLCRNSLLTAALGLATCFSVDLANADSLTPTTGSITTFSSPQCGNGAAFTHSSPETCVAIPTATATGANVGNIAAIATTTQVEQNIEERRKRRLRRNQNPLGYAPEPGDDATRPEFDAAFGALGYAPTYAKAPMYTKAQPLESGIESAVWANGHYENYNQAGTYAAGCANCFGSNDIGLHSQTWGGLAGADWTWTLPSETYWTFGVFAGATSTFLSAPTGATATTTAPTAGVYVMYFKGDFSADLTYTAAWMNNTNSDANTSVTIPIGLNTAPCISTKLNPCTATTTATALATVSMMDHLEGNLHYKYDLSNNWWWEPTVGFAWMYEVENLGLVNMETWRVQGGAKTGTSFMWGNVTVEPTVTGLVFSDVSVTGGFAPGQPLLENDQGQVWGKGIGKLNFIWSKNFESSIEGQVYGTRGLETVIAYKAELGLRYKW
jgi:hypothetical protein